MNNITDLCKTDISDPDYSSISQSSFHLFSLDQSLMDSYNVGPYSGLYSNYQYSGFLGIDDSAFLYSFGDGSNNASLNQ